MSTIIDAPVTQPVTTIDVPAVTDKEGWRREVLLRAAEIVEARGWTTGGDGMIVDGGPVCLLGAVAHAAQTSQYIDEIALPTPSLRYCMLDPATILGIHYEAAYGWNDRLPYVKKPRAGWRRRMSGGEVVADVLRQMANGTRWEDATHGTWL